MGGESMTFSLSIVSQSERNNNKRFLDEEEAIEEAFEKNRIVAYA